MCRPGGTETDSRQILTEWLKAEGLEQYAEALHANDVDLDLLRTLTSDDLKEIGVASVGHRRKLMIAAAGLRAPAAQVAPPASDLALQAEQRMVSAMFCDLVGSTQLSSILDPEDYRDLIAEFRKVVGAALLPYRGHVARFLGDGILVLFGTEAGEEQTTENAVAAAMEILRRTSATTTIMGTSLQVRIGLATGMTVVKREMADETDDDSVVGQILNLAARLQAVAEPNTVVVTQATRDRLGGLFICEDLGLQDLKGIEGRVRAWKVISHSETESRFDALHESVAGTGFFGREDELGRLRVQAALAREGNGQISMIVGPSGIGKSRLARECQLAAARVGPHLPILQCTSYHSSNPFHPMRRYILRLLGPIEPGRDRAEAIAKLLERFDLSGGRQASLLADFIAVEVQSIDGHEVARERRAELIALLTDLFFAIGREARAIILEDVQWIDPSTSEMLVRVAKRIGQEPVHVLCTIRPGPTPDWCVLAGGNLIRLERLPDTKLAALIRSVAKTGANPVTLSAAQVADVVIRSDGNPVFAKELTRYLLTTIADGRAPDDQPLPTTLADSLLARLDRLAEGKRLAQLCAVIGNEFPLALLEAIADLPERQLQQGVADLIEADVLKVGHSEIGPAVAFRHILFREAAYMTILRRDRVALHARIAGTLVDHFPKVAEESPQIVAQQFSLGGDPASAAEHWNRAGTRAARRSAYAEAIGLFNRALEDAATLGDTPETKRSELGIRLNLVSSLIASDGFNSEAVKSEMAKVEALGSALKSGDQLMGLMVSKWVFLGAGGQIWASLEVARQIRDLASTGTAVEQILSHRVMGTSLLFVGRFAEAKRELEAFMELYDPERHAGDLARYGTSNHAAMTAVGLTELAVFADDAARAEHWGTRAMGFAQKSGQIHDLCNVTLFIGCILPAMRGDHERVAISAAKMKDLAATHNLPMWLTYADLFHRTNLVVRGHTSEARWISSGEASVMAGAASFLSFCLMYYAEACLSQGLVAEARESLLGINPRVLREENWLSAETARLEAEIRLAEGAGMAAVAEQLDRAEDIARRQGAILFLRKINLVRRKMQP